MRVCRQFLGAMLGAAIGFGTIASAETSTVGTYFIGVDNAATVTFGAYAGLANTNQGRLTFLFYHGDHFHGIGTHAYTGPAASATPVDTNTNNRIPEGYTGLAPISLQPGAGSFAGTYRSGLPSTLDQDQEYGDLTIRNVHALAGVDDVIYNSSNGRWNGSFDSAHIHMVLLSATPGLKIAFGSTPTDSLPVGGDFHVGDGDEMFSVLPTFWVDDSATLGTTYIAEFLLTDTLNGYGNSGRFFIDFQVVPEPASMMLLGLGAGALCLRRRALA